MDCFKSNGKEISEFRYPGRFTRIDTYDKIEVNVFKGTTYQVEVIAGKNIIKNISTIIRNDTLRIENKNKCNFVRGYKRNVKVNITMPHLYSASNNSVAKLTVDEGFTQDSIRVRAESSGDILLNGTYSYIRALSNGNGDITVNGKCDELFVYINGTNFFNSQNLQVKERIYIETLSLGDAFLNAEDLKKLDYIIFSKGNIYYHGDPLEITGTLDKKGEGKLIRQD